MSTNELESKVRELRQLQALIAEAEAEAETIRDAIKVFMGDSGEYRITWKHVYWDKAIMLMMGIKMA